MVGLLVYHKQNVATQEKEDRRMETPKTNRPAHLLHHHKQI